ncbi:MAG: hypothetical protein KAR40_17925 [Candidatus Sabulitectum sp.]|nr:hypothetical protein [Candidatus Sabulitectum sp.]
MEILDKVHGFYADAWSQLLIFAIAAISIVGVLMPILLQILQNRMMQREKDALERSMQQRIEEIGQDLEVKLANIIEDKTSKYEQQLKKGLSQTHGGLLQLQGMSRLTNRLFALATYDLAGAATAFLSADDELNLRRVLKVLIDSCLPNLKEEDYHNEAVEAGMMMKKLVHKLTEKNENRKYTDEIRDIRKKCPIQGHYNSERKIEQ